VISLYSFTTSYWRHSVFTCLQCSKLGHVAPMQQLDCCVKIRQTLLRPTCGLQTAQISIVWIMKSGLSCSIVSTTYKSVVWINWNGGSSMSGAVLNSRFFTRLLTSVKEDFQLVYVLKEYTISTTYELTMLISITFSVTFLALASLITKLCQ